MADMNKKTIINKGGRILLGTGLLAFSIKSIYEPCGMVIGGFSGVAIIVKHLTQGLLEGGIPLGITTFCLNIPGFILAYPRKGANFVKKTIISTLLVSIWLMILPEYKLAPDDYLLTAIAGGVIGGAGIGIVLLAGSSTGGTDMVATLLQVKLPYYSVAQIMAGVDAIIMLASVYLFGIQAVLYAGVSLFIHAKVTDAFVLGTHFAKSVYIITEKPELIAEAIMERLQRGVTGIVAEGMYTGNEKKMLFCVVSKKEVVKIKQLVLENDRRAFVIVGEAKEVLGEGF